MKSVAGFIFNLSSHIVPSERPVDQPQPNLLELVDMAREEWLAAKTYFENVSDPELVDHAIYAVEAAEKKYMYLLKQAKAQNITLHALQEGNGNRRGNSGN